MTHFNGTLDAGRVPTRVPRHNVSFDFVHTPNRKHLNTYLFMTPLDYFLGLECLALMDLFRTLRADMQAALVESSTSHADEWTRVEHLLHNFERDLDAWIRDLTRGLERLIDQ